jgi:hypothetical protein
MNRLAILLGAALLLSGCKSSEDFNEVPAERAKLAAGLLSYSSPSVVGQTLGVDPTTWKLLEDTKYDGSSRRPAYRMQIALVPGQAVAGRLGDLELWFFNERLMEVYFCPENYLEFLDLLADRHPGIKSAQTLKVGKHVELRVGPPARKECVVWGDIRLQHQLERWIRENA